MSQFCSPKKVEHRTCEPDVNRKESSLLQYRWGASHPEWCSPDATKTEKSSGQVSFVQFCPANQALTYCTVRPFWKNSQTKTLNAKKGAKFELFIGIDYCIDLWWCLILKVHFLSKKLKLTYLNFCTKIGRFLILKNIQNCQELNFHTKSRNNKKSTNIRILYKNGSLEQCGQGKMIFSSCFCGHQQDWQRDFSSVASKIGRKIEIS